jgi:hypothetical protein
VEEMRSALIAIVRSTSLNDFPEPFNSWIAITREKNIFFMTKATDGRRAIHGPCLKEKVKPLPSPSPLSRSSSQNARTYPAELQLSKLETKRIDFLSSVLLKILLNAPVEVQCTYTACPVRYDRKEALTRTPTHEDPSLSGVKEPSIRSSNPSSAKNIPEIPSEHSFFHGYAEHVEHQRHDQQHEGGEEDEEEQTMYRQESRGRDRAAAHSPPGQGQPSLSYSPSSLSISSSISSPHPSAPSTSFAHPQYTSSMSLESSRSRVRPINSRQGCTDDDNTLSLSLPPPVFDDTPPLSPAITHLNKSDGSADESSHKESSHTVELDLIVEEMEKQRQLYAKYAEDCLSMFINAEVEKRRKDVKVKIEKRDGNEMEKEEAKDERDKDEKDREGILPKEIVEMLRAMDNQESKAGQKKQKKEKREKHVRRKSRLQRCLDCQNLVANSIDFSVYSNAHAPDEK